MPLDLFPRSNIFTILAHRISTLKPRKALVYWAFHTLTYQPLLSIRLSQHDTSRGTCPLAVPILSYMKIRREFLHLGLGWRDCMIRRLFGGFFYHLKPRVSSYGIRLKTGLG